MADRSSLRADCARCAALCCVAPAFARSADFAVDKPAGVPCLLLADDRCSIHDRLRERGFAGCATYDCFGAGQAVVQHTYAGRDRLAAAHPVGQVLAVFTVVRGLHELLWYLLEARDLPEAAPLRDDIVSAISATDELAQASADRLLRVDVDSHRGRYVPLLRRASELAREQVPAPRPDHAGADLVGASLRRVDLAGADLRGALLVGADLRGADLHLADVTGADLRAADVRGTDLGSVLFATQAQVDAARGDGRTTLPGALTRPAQWPVTPDTLGPARSRAGGAGSSGA